MRKISARISLSLLILFCLSLGKLSAQNVVIKSSPNNPDPNMRPLPVQKIARLGVIKPLEQEQEDFGAILKNIKVIHQPGVDIRKDEYIRRKAEANAAKQAAMLDGSYGLEADKTNITEPPTVGHNFFGNSFNGGIPNDNNITVSNDGFVVSATNTRIHMYSETGTQLYAGTLGQFVTGQGIPNGTKFDPKCTYDPVNDRFIVVFLSGSSANSSTIVVCFSQTNDPTGNWNVYGITGNPDNLNVWTDFPSIGISSYELFVTGNLFTNSGGAQGGVVHQIRLADGYAGNSLTVQTYTNNYFSLHPVDGGLAPYGRKFYIIRNETSGSSTDFFIHEVTDTMGVGTLNAPVAVPLPQSYTLPPDATQKGSNTTLSTNDCRIQSSYYENNRIQFAFNTGVSNKPSVYVGTIVLSPLGLNFSQAKANILTFSGLEIAYPGIAYGGTQGPFGTNTSYVMFTFASSNHYPSHGVVYFDTDEQYSATRTLRPGSNSIGMGGNWRWGDYSGIDERRNNPGEVWVGGSYAMNSGNTMTYISQVTTPPPLAIDDEITPASGMTVAPNPAIANVRFEFPVEKAGMHKVSILDLQGKTVAVVVNDFLRPGQGMTTFDTQLLPAGIYIVQVNGEEGEIYREKFVVTK
ncbi:MAG: T9SS type A sorting domain-containing protein [Bacteroidia bacterium]|nr:T9SS type A sorting domain-containing protein [Bacteroidia bacterium]